MSKAEKSILLILGLIVFFCVFSISFYAIRTSNDEFWHLKTGEYIVQHGYHLPQKDIFTYTAADMDWVNHEWLSQVLFYQVYAISGLKGFVLFKSLVIMAAFAAVLLVCYQRTKDWYLSLFAVMLGALASRHTLYPRPYIFSYLLLPVYLYFLYQIKETGIKKWHYALFPLLMVLWANLHGGAILGIILIGFFFGDELITYLWNKGIKHHQNSSYTLLKGLFNILCLTLVASLVNPYGWKIYELTSKVMTNKTLIASIGELQPPDFRFTTYYLAMLIITGLAVLTTVKRLRISDALLLLFFGQQSLCHVRHLPLFGITAASILAVHMNYVWNQWAAPLNQAKKWLNTILIIGIIWLTYSILINNHQLQLNAEMLEGPGFRVDNYPVRAANFILQHDFQGNMFNEINSAGYLMFKLNPKHKVFTDNRFDLFGSKFLPDFYEISEAGPQWQQTLDKYNVNFIVINYHESSRLYEALLYSDTWTRVYQDPDYVIFLRNDPKNQKLIQSLQVMPSFPQ
jgi:hypothetical protein